MDTEKTRQRYKPRIIRYLFVCESPPCGGTFFYYKNSKLFNYTHKVFQNIFGIDSSNFLEYFRDNGFYLDDLCLTPINGLSNSDRKRCRKRGIYSLAERLKIYQPEVIISTPLAIRSEVVKSIELSGQNPRSFHIPFAGNGQQNKFVEQLSDIIKNLSI